MADLETVDIAAIPVLSTGGPVRGIGSPPEGDYWSRDDLEKIAEANRALAAEVKAPNKIGHSDRQQLLAASGLTKGEMPAVGWLDGETFRVIDTPDGDGAVLVADAKAVPKKFSALVEAGAYRTRSAELSRVTSQVSGKVYEWVVTGLAWLGAQLPAVQTLDDVVALYERAELEVPAEVKTYVVYATGDLVWSPGASFQSLRDDVQTALNGPPTGGMNEPRFWVSDIALASNAALVQDWTIDGDGGWVVPFTRSGDGTVTISPSSDWTSVEQGWIAAAKEYARNFSRAAESRAMPELTITDEQVAALGEKLGLDGEITPEAIVEAVETRANELAEAKTKADEADARKLEADEASTKIRELEERAKTVERKLFEKERDDVVGSAIRDGRVTPAEKDKWEKRYEDNAELTKEILSELKPDEDLVRELGREPERDEDDPIRKDYEAEIARNTGVPVEELI